MPRIGQLIILNNGMGGNITSLVKMNDGRHAITIKPINGEAFSFMQGDYTYKAIVKVHIKKISKGVLNGNLLV